MNHHLKTRIAKLEQWRIPRAPYVVRVNYPITAEDRAAVANAQGRVAVLPYKCATVAEWSMRYPAMETLQ